MVSEGRRPAGAFAWAGLLSSQQVSGLALKYTRTNLVPESAEVGLEPGSLGWAWHLSLR